MKHIHQALKEITLQGEYDIPAVEKFLKTTKGATLVKRLAQGTSLTILEKDLQLPKLHTKDYFQRIGLWKNTAKKLSLWPKDAPKTVDMFAINIHKLKATGKLKLPHTLTKKELYEQINSEIVRDKDGNPIQQKDRSGKLLWNGRANTPIYKRKRRTERIKGLPEALKCHLYELHKMAKWDKKHPAPTELNLKQDLFPEALKLAHNVKREAHLEHIRRVLSDLYCKGKKILDIIAICENRYLKNRYPSMHLSHDCDISKFEDYLGDSTITINSKTTNSEMKQKVLELLSSPTIQNILWFKDVIGIKLRDSNGNIKCEFTIDAPSYNPTAPAKIVKMTTKTYGDLMMAA